MHELRFLAESATWIDTTRGDFGRLVKKKRRTFLNAYDAFYSVVHFVEMPNDLSFICNNDYEKTIELLFIDCVTAWFHWFIVEKGIPLTMYSRWSNDALDCLRGTVSHIMRWPPCPAPLRSKCARFIVAHTIGIANGADSPHAGMLLTICRCIDIFIEYRGKYILKCTR